MYTLLTKMFRQPRKAVTTKRTMNLLTLEDRVVPTIYTFGGVGNDATCQ